MKTMFRAIPPLLAVSMVVSCGTMDLVRNTSAATSAKVAQLSKFSISDLRPAGVKVVDVRQKDLKELPTGQERATAFENKRKRSFWAFVGAVDFEEPTLPEPGAGMDGSLLPPKSD